MNALLCFTCQVDLLRNKSKLLEYTAELTCGVVNGRKIRVKTRNGPPRPDKGRGRGPEAGEEEPEVGPADDCEHQSGLSREQQRFLRTQRGWAHFKDVFMLSAVDGEGVEPLKVI